ncbi:LuxR C-terminal-related transcriptional regulator, partial [Streptomyces sp. NPDC006510]|uniref:response regulator transcription factor n=1 Tax=Streptomyces sp. NPDC006510 TaxID=3155600 RepID=UPI0033AB1004
YGEVLLRLGGQPVKLAAKSPVPVERGKEALTKRELEVLQLVGEGLSNLQISKRLFLSQATVKSHLVHIYAKLGVDSRTSAVAAATARRLIRR